MATLGSTGLKTETGDVVSISSDLTRIFVQRDDINTVAGILGIDPLSFGALYSWGDNSFGRLGSNDLTNRSSPTQVGTVNDWSKVSISKYTAGSIKSDGSLWTWGRNNQGQLGLGNSINMSSPTQVGALVNWKDLSMGAFNSMSVKTDGSLWGWGTLNYGSLPLNGAVPNSPTQIGTLTNWKRVEHKDKHSIFVKTDGTLWTSGFNNLGQLGLGNAIDRSSPTQVGTLTNWSYGSVADRHSLAVKTDGTLWAWGRNSAGQLGLNNTTSINSPAQVGTLTDWRMVSAGGGYNEPSSFGVKTDGTLWAWGAGGSGGLGLNAVENKSSPTQVGTLTNWKNVKHGDFSAVAAIKTDGTLWSWGRNPYGELGLNDITSKSSPTQIGSLTGWTKVAMGGYNFTAVQKGAGMAIRTI